MTSKTNAELHELEGKIISLSGIRKINTNQVSQAVFLIKTLEGSRRVMMFLWDLDASKIRELVIGNHYKFKAVAENYGKEIVLFCLPAQTQFQLLSAEDEIQ